MDSGPGKIGELLVSINGSRGGRLLKASTYKFRYESAAMYQRAALTMSPRDALEWEDGSPAELLQQLQLPPKDLHKFFEQVTPSIMVCNGDTHLKNFGLLLPEAEAPRLSPVFDVVTTAAYTYTRFAGDVEQT